MIELKNVSYAYPLSADNSQDEKTGTAICVANISLSLAPGERVALVGANGAGKSTIGRMLCGTLSPSSGEVLLDGLSANSDELHRRVGYVRQDPLSQLIAPVVFDEVSFGPCNLGLPEAEVRERVSWALDACNLSGFETHLVNELSGGEVQRVALAGVLALRPDYLILDEVTSQLDSAARESVRTVIDRLVQEGLGVLEIAHSALEVARAQRVVLLEAGCVVWQGSTKEFFSQETLVRRACLRIPQEPQFISCERPRTTEARLSVSDVCVSYNNKLALVNVSMRACAGELTLVAGCSGSGKSTLVSVACGLLEADSGNVLLDNRRVYPGMVGYCMQRCENQLFSETVLEDVVFGPKNFGVSHDQAYEQAQKALDSLGISERLWKKSPFALSGGQRRRVALAGIIALNTDVYIFDEPTVGLDNDGCKSFKAVVYNLLEQGKSVVVVSHDLEEWLDMASNMLVLSDGKLVWSGEPCDFCHEEEPLSRAGLSDFPWMQMKGVLAALQGDEHSEMRGGGL